MSEYQDCPTCGVEVHMSYNALAAHENTTQHILVTYGVPAADAPALAAQINQAAYAAGANYDAAMMMIRKAMSQPVDPEAIRAFARLVGR